MKQRQCSITLNRHRLIFVFLMITLGSLIFYRLDSVPPLWYDEGFILSVVRNWVEFHHYGQFLSGKPVPVTIMNIGIPATGLYAISFKLLGAGGYQGRIVSAFFTIINLGLLYVLARKLFRPSIGLASVLSCVLILPSISFNAAINPIIIGRQALGEMPALFYLLLGYVFLVYTEKYNPYRIFFTIILFGLASLTKLQILPFLVVGLMIPIVLMLKQHDWRYLKVFQMGTFGLIIFIFLFRSLSPVLDNEINPTIQKHLFSLISFVPIYSMKHVYDALSALIIMYLPSIVGFIYSGSKLLREIRLEKLSYEKYIELSLISFGTSWTLWFIFFSIGWSRYLFIPYFLGSIFTARLIADLTQNFNIDYVVNKLRSICSRRQFRIKKIVILIYSILITFYVLMNIFGFVYLITYPTDNSLRDVISSLNSSQLPHTLVETSEMELFIYLNQPYHFPPDKVFLNYVQRKFLDDEMMIDYDPLKFDPNLLVIGPTADQYRIYDRALSSGEFKLWQDFGRYQVYTRVNN